MGSVKDCPNCGECDIDWILGICRVCGERFPYACGTVYETMTAREALEYLERVVEDRADIDPAIHAAIGVLSKTVDHEREQAGALEWIADKARDAVLYRHFSPAVLNSIQSQARVVLKDKGGGAKGGDNQA